MASVTSTTFAALSLAGALVGPSQPASLDFTALQDPIPNVRVLQIPKAANSTESSGLGSLAQNFRVELAPAELGFESTSFTSDVGAHALPNIETLPSAPLPDRPWLGAGLANAMSAAGLVHGPSEELPQSMSEPQAELVAATILGAPTDEMRARLLKEHSQLAADALATLNINFADRREA